MKKAVSVIIPNYNGASTIGRCIEAALASDHVDFEVVVVDDCSDDGSPEIISRYPCRLIRLDKRSGASRARNTGAANAKGRILFFIDSDCVLKPDALSLAEKTLAGRSDVAVGGTYTPVACDDTFFSTFQSVFINYHETKTPEPDYIASHALVIDAELFRRSGGFPEDFMPIIEDVEYSHRLRRSGVRLLMNPDMLVEHIFNFTLAKSLKNAFKKSRYWMIYSMGNRDVLSDSGTASRELKINVVSWGITVALAASFLLFGSPLLSYAASAVICLNVLLNAGFLSSYFRAKGAAFGVLATLYYLFLYPAPVAFGSALGMAGYYLGEK